MTAINSMVVYISPDECVLATPDARIHRVPTPDGVLASLDVLLARVHRMFGTGAGVVLLDADARAELGIPARLPRIDRRTPPVVPLDPAHPDGGTWRTTVLAGWFTAWGERRPTVHVAFLEWCKLDEIPFYDPDPVVLVRRFAWWHRLTGTPWHTTSGATGVGLFKDQPTGRHIPFWRPKFDGSIPIGQIERECQHWQASPFEPVPEGEEAETDRWVHYWDGNKTYASVAGTTPLPVGALRHTGRRIFDRNAGGYWRIDGAGWHEPRLPDPCGSRDGQPVSHEGIWVTTPTLELLTQLCDLGVYGGYKIIDSWTAPAFRVMRTWSETIRDALYTLADFGRQGERCTIFDPADVAPLSRSLKMCYAHGIGMLGRPGGRIYRPDYRETIVAAARVNLWRRMWQCSSTAWPAEVRFDCVGYLSDSPAPMTVPRPARGDITPFKIDSTGMKYGTYKLFAVVRVRHVQPTF